MPPRPLLVDFFAVWGKPPRGDASTMRVVDGGLATRELRAAGLSAFKKKKKDLKSDSFFVSAVATDVRAPDNEPKKRLAGVMLRLGRRKDQWPRRPLRIDDIRGGSGRERSLHKQHSR